LIPQFRLSLVVVATLIGLVTVVAKSLTPRGTEPAEGRPAYDERFFSPQSGLGVKLPVDSALSGVVDDTQLESVLVRVTPCWDNYKVAFNLHALRLWGTKVAFSDIVPTYAHSRVYSGPERMSMLLNHSEFERHIPGARPLLRASRHGVHSLNHVDAGSFVGSTVHEDALLAACADAGLPLSTSVVTVEGEFTLADVLSDSVARFSLTQELEWTTLADSSYLAPAKCEWTNKFGDTYSFDDVVGELLDRTSAGGACHGAHVPFALASVYACNDINDGSVISPTTNNRIEKYFHEIQRRLAQRQAPSGSWDSDWYQSLAMGQRSPDQVEHDRLIVTGHLLEWVAVVPEEFRPPRHNIIAAVEFVTDVVTNCSPRKATGFYAPNTHVARALCLMRGHTLADELWATVVHRKHYRE